MCGPVYAGRWTGPVQMAGQHRSLLWTVFPVWSFAMLKTYALVTWTETKFIV